MSIGNRVFLQKPEAAQELLDAFAQIPCANIADAINRSCALNPRIKLMSSPKQSITAGRALTVKTRSGDNLMLHKALNMAKEGDAILLSNDGGEFSRSLIGEIMFTIGLNKKIASIIIDGPIRDIDAVKDFPYHIYATGTTPGGPYKEGPGEVNVPISCGGISVNPGDIVVMDADGIIVIPLQDAEVTLKAAQAFQAQDVSKLVAAQEGRSKRDWVEKTLEAKNCEIIDGCYYDFNK